MAPSLPSVKAEKVHAKLEEKITLTAGRDGGLRSLEVLGMLTIRIADEASWMIKLGFEGPTNKGFKLQPHPNIDEELLKTRAQIALKNPSKPFRTNTDVGVLKWRFSSQDESFIPLSIDCWPSDNGQGGCDVYIDYKLVQDQLELQDVIFAVPIAHGAGAPVVSECVGNYSYEKLGCLLWQLPVIDASNKSGRMVFSCHGRPDDFFPIRVSFYSKKTYSGIQVKALESAMPSVSDKHSSLCSSARLVFSLVTIKSVKFCASL